MHKTVASPLPRGVAAGCLERGAEGCLERGAAPPTRQLQPAVCPASASFYQTGGLNLRVFCSRSTPASAPSCIACKAGHPCQLWRHQARAPLRTDGYSERVGRRAIPRVLRAGSTHCGGCHSRNSKSAGCAVHADRARGLRSSGRTTRSSGAQGHGGVQPLHGSAAAAAEAYTDASCSGDANRNLCATPYSSLSP